MKGAPMTDPLQEASYAKILAAWEREHPVALRNEPPPSTRVPYARRDPCPHNAWFYTCRPCKRAYDKLWWIDHRDGIKRPPGERIALVLAKMGEKP